MKKIAFALALFLSACSEQRAPIGLSPVSTDQERIISTSIDQYSSLCFYSSEIENVREFTKRAYFTDLGNCKLYDGGRDLMVLRYAYKRPGDICNRVIGTNSLSTKSWRLANEIIDSCYQSRYRGFEIDDRNQLKNELCFRITTEGSKGTFGTVVELRKKAMVGISEYVATDSHLYIGIDRHEFETQDDLVDIIIEYAERLKLGLERVDC